MQLFWLVVKSVWYRKEKDMEKKLRVIETGLDKDNKKFNEILRSIIGQLSDGMWENCSRYQGYWTFDEGTGKDNKIIVSNELGEWNRNWSHMYKNPYHKMTDQQIRKFFANKIKFLVKQEFADDYNYFKAKEIFKKGSSWILREEETALCCHPERSGAERRRAVERSESWLGDDDSDPSIPFRWRSTSFGMTSKGCRSTQRFPNNP